MCKNLTAAQDVFIGGKTVGGFGEDALLLKEEQPAALKPKDSQQYLAQFSLD